jgi:hypothetical protein
MTIALFLLRAAQMGLSMADLDELEAGRVFDMMIESGNDDFQYPQLASQEDMDRF